MTAGTGKRKPTKHKNNYKRLPIYLFGCLTKSCHQYMNILFLWAVSIGVEWETDFVEKDTHMEEPEQRQADQGVVKHCSCTWWHKTAY